MDEAPKKGNPSLSIDRAAFLLLRVKKAFKKKRQQRKEKQAAQQAAAALAEQTRAYKRGPPPLLRSRTLPAIVVPGISILQAQIDPNRLSAVDSTSNVSFYGARWSLQPKSSRASLISDDSSFELRRKSSGSTHSGPPLTPSTAASIISTSTVGGGAAAAAIATTSGTTTINNNNYEPYIYACDDYERHPDGSVVLRIPAPHVVAARAYRMSCGSSNMAMASGSSGGGGAGTFSQQIPLGIAGSFTAGGSSSSGGSNSSSNAPLYRLARLLNQSTKTAGRQSPTLKDDAPRRLSWERRDHANNRIPRSASIDSMVESVWSDSPRPSLDVPRNSTTTITLQQSISQSYIPNQQVYLLNTNFGSFSGSSSSRRESLLSPSSGRRTKQNRGIAEITLPDLITRSSLQSTPNKSPPPIVLSGKQSSSATTTTTPTSIINTAVAAANIIQPNALLSGQLPSSSESGKFPHLKLKSPLFRQLSKTQAPSAPPSSSSSSSSSLTSSEVNNAMEFLIPQLPRHSRPSSSSANSKIAYNNGFHFPIQLQQKRHQQQQQQQQHQQQQQQKQHQQQQHNQQHQQRQPQQKKLLIHQQSLPTGNKMTKKQIKLAQAQLEKLTQINIHLHALFSAVEHGHLEKAKTILESTDVDVNSLNSDGLSPLDVAVLSNNRPMTKMLLQHGAIEGSQYKTPDTLGNHLNGLLHDAENRVQDLSSADDMPQPPLSARASFSSIIGNSGPSVTGCTGTEADKQLGLWERRVKGLRRMLLGWDQARPPDMPSAITIDVAGINSVTVCILEPMEGSIGTKFKIQWSTRADFSNIVGERDLYEWSSYQGIMGATCQVNDLTQGRRYFFRANCGNVKGWGPYRLSVPSSVIPSSWRDMDNREHRFAGRQRILDDLFTAVRLARPEDACELILDTPAVQRRNPKKKTTIKQLFSAASKFQKNLRRGIYLACILYYDDRILVTNEDFLPVIEIDETYPSSLHTDYHWLMKVACTWDDVKSLRTDMERNSTSAVHFRTKLLSAACQMQSALCITDLGQLYHKPLRDSHGTVVLSCVNAVKSPKSISVLNSRWVPLNKIQKKVTALHEDNNISEILISSIAEQINYHQTSSVKLSRGLYLGYLKMQSSVDQIQVVVPVKTPNVLPHCKIRENPHISAEEWEVLKQDKMAPSLEFRPKCDGNTEVQKMFLESLTAAANKLFNYMNISQDDVLIHRLYDIEVIELSGDVSFLIVCPPVESSCAVPGQREILLQRGDLLSLSLQAFEMIHLRTYQNSIIQKYSRLSCILELDTALANHSHREAFSTSELQMAKERLAKLQELTFSLNTVWKSVRWLMDVIGFTRDRGTIPGVTMKEILEFNKMEINDENDGANTSCNNQQQQQQQLLQLPQRDNKLVKSSPGRGSWPGPAASSNLSTNSFLVAEHSRSEQNLGCAGSSCSSRFLSATSCIESSSRKNSADSQSGNSYFSAGESSEHIAPRLPPSRSEDTLVTGKKHLPATIHRKRSTTLNTSPQVNLKPATKYTTDSLQSLSSDSEGSSYPLLTSTPNKLRTKIRSESEKLRVEGGGSFLKPTLTALQSEIKLFKEPLHISEPSSPLTKSCGESFRKTTTIGLRQSSDEEDLAAGLGSSSGGGGGSALSSSSSATKSNHSGIIQVYAAYETGLAHGTSLKLHVTPKTSAREVVDLVVKQLNMAVLLKGKEGPIYAPDKLENFCLVAVIGARERCLRDDFKPLQLQNPWRKGRLYVRQKHDLLAAIEHSNRDAQLI